MSDELSLPLPLDVEIKMRRLVGLITSAYEERLAAGKWYDFIRHRPGATETDIKHARRRERNAIDAHRQHRCDATHFFGLNVLPHVTGGAEWKWAARSGHTTDPDNVVDHGIVYQQVGARYRYNSWKNTIVLGQPYIGAVIGERIRNRGPIKLINGWSRQTEIGEAWRLPDWLAIYYPGMSAMFAIAPLGVLREPSLSARPQRPSPKLARRSKGRKVVRLAKFRAGRVRAQTEAQS